jgi:hypothetical protein
MFLASPFLVIWMVYRVLRADTTPTATFDEKFYEDHDYRKIPDESVNP